MLEQQLAAAIEKAELLQIRLPPPLQTEWSETLVAAKRELIETKLALLSEAGLEPAIIEWQAMDDHRGPARGGDARPGDVVSLATPG